MKRATAFVLLLLVLLHALWSCAESPAVPEEVFGEVVEGIYRNPCLGFGFSCDGWHYQTEEERERNVNINSRAWDVDFEEDGKKTSWVTVMSANLPDYQDSINVGCLFLGNDAAYFENMDERELMEMLLDSAKESIEESGFTIDSFDLSDISISGYELPCYLAECSLSNMWYMSHFFMIETYFISESYMVSIIAYADDSETAKDILQHIFWM